METVGAPKKWPPGNWGMELGVCLGSGVSTRGGGSVSWPATLTDVGSCRTSPYRNKMGSYKFIV